MSAIASADIKYKAWTLLEGLCRLAFGRSNYHLFFLFVAAFECILFVHVFRREAIDYTIACFFFFAAGYYYNNFSMMRQWLAVSIVFTSIGALRDRKFFKYALICFIGGLFHPSAWLCIPIYFLVEMEPWSPKQLGIAVLFAVGMLFMNPILSTLNTEDAVYSDVLTAMAGDNGSSIIRVFIAAVPVALAYFGRTGKENATFKVCLNLSIVNTMLNLLAAFTSGLYVIRFTTYISIFNVILYPYLLDVNWKNNKNIKIAFYVLYLAYFIYATSHQGAWGYKRDVLTLLTNY